MPSQPKHIPTHTYDCPECGEVYWLKEGREVIPCEMCGTALVLRPEGTKAPMPRRLMLDDDDMPYVPPTPPLADEIPDDVVYPFQGTLL